MSSMAKSSSSPAELASALSDAATLLEASSEANLTHNFEAILKNRLIAYYNRLNAADSSRKIKNLSSREDIEFLTAREALSLIERVQKIVDVELDESLQEPPPLGTRDLKTLGTLLSLVFKWAIDPLYVRVSRMWPASIMQSGSSRKISDLSTSSNDYPLLSEFTNSFLALVFPDGSQGRISQTLITTSILSRHVTDLLLPALALGWLPETMSSESTPVMHGFRPLVLRLMRLLTPAQTIGALGGILSSTDPTPPAHVRKACTSLLTKQLLRPDGVQGLCTAMFSEEESSGEEAQLDKLEQIARILNSVPSNMSPTAYFGLIFPRVLHNLTKSMQRSHQRAAAFTIYRALVPEKVSPSSADASSIVLSLLHEHFLVKSYPSEKVIDSSSFNAREALEAITTLLGNTEPSPVLISKLLSPIIPALYGLSYDTSRHKTADPQLKESVLGLLKAWGKIVDQPEGERILWAIIEGGKAWDWKFDLEGNFWKVPRQEQKADLLLMPRDSKSAEDTEEADIDLNIFDLYPDPVHFVEILKDFDRGDIASSVFVKMLEVYRDMKGQSDDDSLKVLHKLQIIMQMQKRLSEGTTSNILRKPDSLLPFIHRVLASANIAAATGDDGGSKSEDDIVEEGDSDDEDSGPEVVGPDNELIETTITLLLSILEVDESLSVASHPILNDIFSLLEPLSTKGTIALRPLAREARLVMTARLAGTSGVHKPKNKAEDDAQEIYQRALKLLQDPILPVRAHGLLLLRELLGPSYSKDSVSRALMPSILSIFLQSVQDEDSYIFLNAVQGLALLVDRFGKEILQGLLRDYTYKLEGLGATLLTQHDLDVRTRVGEALGSVVKRCGSALGIYVDLLVPPLFAVVRNRNLPTVLRTSSISLLAGCVDTYSLAMLPYVEDLCLGFIDLLQLESISSNIIKPKVETSTPSETEKAYLQRIATPPSTLDTEPTSKNTKFPPLRRAGLHFLTLLIRASTTLIYEQASDHSALVFPKSAVQKASITLGYISSTDEDNLVRVMAREAKENLEQLQRAMLGL